MLGSKVRMSLIAAAAAALLLVSAAPATAATPTPPPASGSAVGASGSSATWDPDAVPAQYPGGAARLNSIKQPSPAAPAACQPQAVGDNVHVTTGDASGHGWWLQGSCSNTKTPVTVFLYEYFSDGTWRAEGTIGYKDVYPGGGSANRANARATCVTTPPTISWESVVNVTIGNGSTSNQFNDISCATQ